MSVSLKAIPFKQAQPISFKRPLQLFIQEEYEEDPDIYLEDFRLLEDLRTQIQDPQIHESSVTTHLIYYAQLHFLETKFSISEERVKLFFTWANAFGKQEHVSSHNIGFEKASVLFNVGAIYSQLAIGALSTGNNNEESYKKVAQYFQLSAGAYQTINDKLPEWNIQGSANIQLNALTNLMLSQAQEVFFLKASSSKMKEGTLAKLAIQTATFYGVALSISEESSVFDKVENLLLVCLNFIELDFVHDDKEPSLYQYKSLESEINGKYGEQVAWLIAAVSSCKNALNKNLIKYVDIQTLENEITSFLSMINIALEKANKDNDKIYMETIPKDLPSITPARMVNPIKIPEYNTISVPKVIFRHLVPLKIHQSASAYAFERDNLIKSLCTKLNEATSLAHKTLASQKLPGSIEALEQPIGLPSIVLDRSVEVKQKGGARSIESSWATLLKFAQKDMEFLNQAIAALDQEEKEDEELRRLYGSKWARTNSATLTKKLREKAKEYKEKIDAANDSNNVVRSKIDNNLVLIEHLGLDRAELEASIPSSNIGSTLALKDPHLKALKGHLDLLNKNIKQRSDIIQRLKKIGESDDIGPKLTANAVISQPLDDRVLFEEQMKVYRDDSTLIQQLISEQEKLLGLIFESNTAFFASHQLNEIIRQRESALSNLDVAYKHFKDISSNLEEGIKFFSELEAILQNFLNNCTDFVKARDLDKQQLLNQIQIGDIGFAPKAPQFGMQGNPGIYNPQQQNPAYNYNNHAFNQPQQFYSNPQYYYGNQPPQVNEIQQMPQQQPGVWNQNQQPYPHQMLPGTWSPDPNPPNPYMHPPK